MFKVGDKVRCIDNRGFDANKYLTVGSIYKVLDTTGGGIIIKIDDYTRWFDNGRFELVKENTEKTKKKMKFVPMDELEVISVNGIDGILIPE